MHNYCNKISRFAALAFAIVMMACPFSASAQNITVTGTVTDANSDPVIGASVMLQGSTTGVPTDIDGNYSISVPANAVLEFSFVGLQTKTEAVNGRKVINVVLTDDENFLESVVVVGYGTQKKGSLTGSVAGVGSEELIKTKSENPQNMLTGRVPGLRVWQTSAEPGSYSSSIDIRGYGSVLVVIDGVPRTIDDFNRLNANDIENVSVLKDGAAAIYGMRGGNGVLLVTTKKGQEGKAKVSYNGSFTFQTPSGLPELVDVFDAMDIWNEKAYNNMNGGSPIFNDEFIEEFRNGTRQVTDWNNLVIQRMAPQHAHDVSISGGGEKYHYYASFGYNYQEGFFKSGDLNYDKYNFRAKMDAEIAKGLTFDGSISGVIDQQNKPYTNSDWLIRNWWRQGPIYPAYADPEQTLLSYEGMDLNENTIAEMTADISGYKTYNKKQFQTQASLTYDFGTITSALKGLNFKALYSFDARFDLNTTFKKEYNLYKNNGDGTYNRQVYADSSPSQLTKVNNQRSQHLYQFILNYNRKFDKHEIGGLIGWEAQRYNYESTNATTNLLFSTPYFTSKSGDTDAFVIGGGYQDVAHMAAIGRLNYNFADRYLIEAQFRYDGSSYFAEGHQWAFFPSISAGWRVSEEPWFKNSPLSFINMLKLRASYATMGDENRANGYAWMTGYTYEGGATSTNGWYNGHVPGYLLNGSMVYMVSPQPLPNLDYSWATIHTMNLGVDWDMWHGLFGGSVDYFRRQLSGLLAQDNSSLPTVVGSSAPLMNLESSENFGMEIQLTHRNKVGDFSYGISTMMTITRQKYGNSVARKDYGSSYDKWRNDNLNNRYQGIQFGYEADGRFESWKDIWEYGKNIYTEANTLPGDYKYLDWNGDGEINGLDEHPYAYDQTPWMNYSLSFDMQYKSFDFSVLFQGSALGSVQYTESLRAIWGVQAGAGGVLTQFKDRWHPAEEGWKDPYDQTLTWTKGYYALTGHEARSNSSYNRISTNYLRVKSIEIGYTLPKFKSWQEFGLRVYANAYNPFTLSHMKYSDPEHPSNSYDRLYPLNKTYTIGLNLSF
ncbi:MAG: TonB-dependent receptor [Bacteroidales bacterium]|nr:TonB-dependent receptor [Bacteroidales bacterium]